MRQSRGRKGDAMANTMTPPKPVTPKQIEKVVAKFRNRLRKGADQMPVKIVQEVLEGKELDHAMADLFRRLVEERGNLIVRTVRVNRSRTPQQAIEATGREMNIAPDVLANMPIVEEETVTVTFFCIDRTAFTMAEADEGYRSRGLVPVDPIALAAVNEAYPSFADEHSNATQ